MKLVLVAIALVLFTLMFATVLGNLAVIPIQQVLEVISAANASTNS